MRKVMILPFFVFAAALLMMASRAQAQTDTRCTTHQTACESEPGLGENDDCCQCPGNEDLCDTDGNGFIDSCCSRDVQKDACHGRYDPADVSPLCDAADFSCCRIPAKRDTLQKDPCHGHETFTDTCPRDAIFESCCVARRTTIHK
jgi:hypothetical protein